jgi:transposase
MAYIEGHARDQALLLPASVEDYVAADSPVRFIDVFVVDLDLGAAGFHRTRPKATGRPGYDPADMLKLYLYGYLNRVRSSRRLEAEATRNLELIWLLRGLRPDYKTIADFRRDNRGAFKAVFRAFVVVCRKLDLFGRELLAVDGTRLKAVNNPGRNFSRAKLARYIAAADERLEGYLGELDAIDRGEDGHGPGRSEALAAKIAHVRERRQVQAAMLEQLNASGESQISLTDPDARAMVTGQKPVAKPDRRAGARIMASGAAPPWLLRICNCHDRHSRDVRRAPRGTRPPHFFVSMRNQAFARCRPRRARRPAMTAPFAICCISAIMPTS